MSKNMIADRYEVFKHIGQGGMADVFLAVDVILNRQVAIKILRSELCTDAVSVLRFEREAQAATALNHPNIVEIYDVGEYKGHHYIVMEYVKGQTLKSVIKKRGALLQEEAVDYMKQLVSATAEAHRRGIIHRDIKPQNVIVKSDGSIKILDFGIALAKGSMQLTQANNVMGSVHYLAPELAKGESATAQSDIYALGIVLYEMLTGDVPFKGESAVQVAIKQMRDDMPDVRSFNSSIPQSLSNIVIRATAKDQTRRYRSCNEMLSDLNTCLREDRMNEPRVILVGSNKDEIDERLARYDSEFHTATNKKVKNGMREDGTRIVNPAMEKRTRKPMKHTFTMVLIIVLCSLLLVALGYYGISNSNIFEPISKEVEIPSDLVGKTLVEAKQELSEYELVLDTKDVTYTLTKDIEKGKIVEINPQPGTKVEKGSSLTVVVSSGIGVSMKDYRGTNINAAKEDLKKYPYIKVIAVSMLVPDGKEVPGSILKQELMEPGVEFNPDVASEIKFTYACYPTITIPRDIERKPIDEAVEELEKMGVEVLTSNLDTGELSDSEIANLETGIVIKSDPDIGEEYTQKEDNYVILYYY